MEAPPPFDKLRAPLEKFLHSFSKTQDIFEENSLGSEMYLVHSGRVNRDKEHGTRRALLANVGPGDFFGEMALVDEGPRSATAIAAKDNTLLVVLDKPKFFYLLRHQPEFALIVMQRLCERLRSTTALVRGLKR
ncbi:MAG: Crp/Fnr family transcriptional regulator [Chloroflexota bacterium]|nr:Crp/Fnr family transcriptional regulator [Chloroflexota bacterium]